jgi:hypothetical protein
MADFEPTQQEIQNVLDPEQNSVTIVDGTTPSYKATVNALGQLSVVVSGGGSAGFLTLDNQLAALGSDVGRIIAGFDGTNYQFVSVNSSGRLQVDVVSGATAGEQHLDGDSITGAKGTVAMGSDGTNFRFLKVDTSGELQVDVLSLPAVTQGTSPWVISGTVTADAGTGPWPVTDNGGSLTVDNAGTFAVQATQSGTWTVQQGTPPWTVSATDLDIRDLTHVSDSVKVGDGTDFLAINTDGSALVDITDDYTRQLGQAKLVDRNGYPLDVADDTALPANYSAILIAGHDEADIVRTPTIVVDGVDGKHRLSVEGKVSISVPPTPPAATAVTISADNPLDVSSTHTTNFLIPSGVTFNMTQITFGAEGDPNEKGSKATVSYVDSGSVVHIVERLYFTGFTAQIFPDTDKARDGTLMLGNGTTTYIRILRERLGGAALEIDCVVRGYYE